MADIADTLAALADGLTQAGVRCVTDPRDVNPPCALTLWPVFEWSFGGPLIVQYRLLIVVPNAGTSAALKTLGPLMDDVSRYLNGAPVQATPSRFVPPEGDPLPGYELTWTAKTKPVATPAPPKGSR